MSLKWIPEMLFGGARGGGKTLALLLDFLQDVQNYKAAWRGILFRRSMPELEEIITQSHEIYPFTGAKFNKASKVWIWGNGAFLKLRFIMSDRDVSKYQGHQYTWIGIDEAGNFPTIDPILKIFACLRSKYNIPDKRVRLTANPGGVGHTWIKTRYIDPEPEGYKIIEDKIPRIYIPSRVTDNKILMESDPEYVERLKMTGSEALVKAWLYGDFNVVAGAYFDDFLRQHHVIDPFGIPSNWSRVMAFDWGSAAPYAVIWGAVVSKDEEGLCLKKGDIVIYREIYGADKSGKGLKQTIEEVGHEILRQETESDKQSLRVADPAIFRCDGGISHAERFLKCSINFFPADNTRVAGWGELRQRIKKKTVKIFKTCHNLIRTLETVQHDEKHPEDIDTRGDDHLADAMRYLVMSRPVIKYVEEKKETVSPIIGHLRHRGYDL
jgi:hypothetical protein